MTSAPPHGIHPVPEALLCTDLMRSSPYFMTALALDGTIVYQSPLSISYYGDVSSRSWAPPDISGAKAGLIKALLHSLFSLEGEPLLLEMLHTVQGGGGDGGGGDGASWCRVLRVPAACSLVHGGAAAAAPQAPLPPRSSMRHASQDTTGSAAWPQASSPALARVADSSAYDLPSTSRNQGLEQGCGVLSALAANTRAGQASASAVQRAHSMSPLQAPPKSGMMNAAGSGSVSTMTGVASALSVAMRTAPKKMKSLLDLSLASGSSQRSRSGTVTPVSAPPAPPPSGLTRAMSLHRKPSRVTAFSLPASSSQPSPAEPQPSLEHLVTRVETRTRFSVAPGSSEAGSPAHGSPLARFPSSGLKQRAGSSTLELGLVSRAGSASSTLLGDSTRALLGAAADDAVGCAGGGSDGQPAGGDLSRARERAAAGAATATAAAAVLRAAVPRSLTSGSLGFRSPRGQGDGGSAGLEDSARNGSCDLLEAEEEEEEGREDAASGASDQHQAQPASQAECWHELFVTTANDVDGRQLLLIYQNDVTLRTQLETAMARLTELQLETLCQIFPRHVIEFMSTGNKGVSTPANLGHLARSHEDVSILFMDIVGFTSMSKQVAANAVMTFLNNLFSVFDELCAVHGVFKVETAGDCYIVSSGLLSPDNEGFSQVTQDHDPEESTAKVFAFAKDMLTSSRKVLMPHDHSPVTIRIGIHTGPCVSGVVGSKLPKFGIFGDTMNTASRMESTCTPGRIQVSAFTHDLLMESGYSSKVEWAATGGIEIKGKGVMETYLWQEPAACDDAVPELQDQLCVLPRYGQRMKGRSRSWVGLVGCAAPEAGTLGLRRPSRSSLPRQSDAPGPLASAFEAISQVVQLVRHSENSEEAPSFSHHRHAARTSSFGHLGDRILCVIKEPLRSTGSRKSIELRRQEGPADG